MPNKTFQTSSTVTVCLLYSWQKERRCLVSVLCRNDRRSCDKPQTKGFKDITKTVPRQLLSLSKKGIWLHMKWRIEIGPYLVQIIAVLKLMSFLEGRQVKYLADESLISFRLFCYCIFLPLFLSLIKANSRMLTQASKVQFPPHIMHLNWKRHI